MIFGKKNRTRRWLPPQFESLENRRLYSTYEVYNEQGVVTSTGTSMNLTSSGDSGGIVTLADPYNQVDTATMTLTNLPAHTMVNVTVDAEKEEHDDSDFSMTAGDSTQTLSSTGVYSPNFSRWFAQSGDTLTITMNLEGGSILVGPIIVTLFTPTVTVSGDGGTTGESTAAPVSFFVSQDTTPGGYDPALDEAVPASHVTLNFSGSADYGTDYTSSVGNGATYASLPTPLTVTLTPKKDNLIEPTETATLSAVSESAPTATASATISDDPPVVSIAAGDANATEAAVGETPDPGTFIVTRTGGDVTHPINVSYTLGGTATPGVDYSESASGTVSVGSSGVITIDPIDDTIAENVETITAALTAGSNYNFNLPPQAVVPATLPTTQPVLLDDNVSVQSITVVIDQTNGAPNNRSKHYYFEARITIVGEHLDKLYLRQLINSSTSEFDASGTSMTRAQILAANPGSDPSVVDSQGSYLPDTGAYGSWTHPSVDPNSKNGIAAVIDTQAGGFQASQKNINTSNNSPVTTVSDEGNISRYMRDQLAVDVPGGSYNRLLSTELDWGYKWNNYSCDWAPNPYAQKLAASFIGKGEFSDEQTITGLIGL